VEITAGTTPGGLPGLVFAFANLVLAWLCWTGKSLAFLIAVVLALLTVVSAYPFPFRGVGGTFDAEIEALLIVSSLLVALFGFRAYREMGQPSAK
jgi:hypothetical protein